MMQNRATMQPRLLLVLSMGTLALALMARCVTAQTSMPPLNKTAQTFTVVTSSTLTPVASLNVSGLYSESVVLSWEADTGSAYNVSCSADVEQHLGNHTITRGLLNATLVRLSVLPDRMYSCSVLRLVRHPSTGNGTQVEEIAASWTDVHFKTPELYERRLQRCATWQIQCDATVYQPNTSSIQDYAGQAWSFQAAPGVLAQRRVAHPGFKGLVTDVAMVSFTPTLDNGLHFRCGGLTESLYEVRFLPLEPLDTFHPDCHHRRNSMCQSIGADGRLGCVCTSGYQPDSNGDCMNINECAFRNTTCTGFETCVDTPGSYWCSCPDGYKRDAFGTCKNVDECQDRSLRLPCGESGSCTDTNGSYVCSCGAGLRGCGANCADIDECTEGTHTCKLPGQSTGHPGAMCVNTVGGFKCKCPAGYSGNGVTCADIDECSSSLGASACLLTPCTNTIGSFFCSCHDGYTRVDGACVDQDECAASDNVCGNAMTTCVNTNGSFVCKCDVGFTLRNGICVNVDECVLGTHECHRHHGLCTDTNGSYTCACSAAFEGDGRTSCQFSQGSSQNRTVINWFLVLVVAGLLLIVIGLIIAIIYVRREKQKQVVRLQQIKPRKAKPVNKTMSTVALVNKESGESIYKKPAFYNMFKRKRLSGDDDPDYTGFKSRPAGVQDEIVLDPTGDGGDMQQDSYGKVSASAHTLMDTAMTFNSESVHTMDSYTSDSILSPGNSRHRGQANVKRTVSTALAAIRRTDRSDDMTEEDEMQARMDMMENGILAPIAPGQVILEEPLLREQVFTMNDGSVIPVSLFNTKIDKKDMLFTMVGCDADGQLALFNAKTSGLIAVATASDATRTLKFTARKMDSRIKQARSIVSTACRRVSLDVDLKNIKSLMRAPNGELVFSTDSGFVVPTTVFQVNINDKQASRYAVATTANGKSFVLVDLDESDVLDTVGVSVAMAGIGNAQQAEHDEAGPVDGTAKTFATRTGSMTNSEAEMYSSVYALWDDNKKEVRKYLPAVNEFGETVFRDESGFSIPLSLFGVQLSSKDLSSSFVMRAGNDSLALYKAANQPALASIDSKVLHQYLSTQQQAAGQPCTVIKGLNGAPSFIENTTGTAVPLSLFGVPLGAQELATCRVVKTANGSFELYIADSPTPAGKLDWSRVQQYLSKPSPPVNTARVGNVKRDETGAAIFLSPNHCISVPVCVFGVQMDAQAATSRYDVTVAENGMAALFDLTTSEVLAVVDMSIVMATGATTATRQQIDKKLAHTVTMATTEDFGEEYSTIAYAPHQQGHSKGLQADRNQDATGRAQEAWVAIDEDGSEEYSSVTQSAPRRVKAKRDGGAGTDLAFMSAAVSSEDGTGDSIYDAVKTTDIRFASLAATATRVEKKSASRQKGPVRQLARQVTRSSFYGTRRRNTEESNYGYAAFNTLVDQAEKPAEAALRTVTPLEAENPYALNESLTERMYESRGAMIKQQVPLGP
ncbi:uncharacterized protein LOC135825836 [Sycon ciliatum]|uniref:uncharacterized protein LOC135825836 n=1 Tax=Sycon ciliatum TaxID=27933 RepID=UPI0031F6CB8B